MNPDEPSNTYVLYTSKIKTASGRCEKLRRIYLNQITEYVLKDKKVIDKEGAKNQIKGYAKDKPGWNFIIDGAKSTSSKASNSTITSVENAPDKLDQ